MRKVISRRAPKNPPWEKWFAWTSVRVTDGQGNTLSVWLEVVERRKVYSYDHTDQHWFWMYRLVK